MGVGLGRQAAVMASDQEMIVNRLLDFEIPKINTASLPKTQLTPIFNEEIGFSRAPVAYHIKKLKQDNESMLKYLRGEIPIGHARVEPAPASPMIRLHDGCWKVGVSFIVVIWHQNEHADFLQVQGQANNDPDEGTLDGVNGEDVYGNQCTATPGKWCHVIIPGKITALCIDNSTSVLFCADEIVEHIYVVNCSKIQLIVGGEVPNIVIENCVGVELLVGTQSKEHTVETEKSSGVVISISKLEVPSLYSYAHRLPVPWFGSSFSIPSPLLPPSPTETHDSTFHPTLL